MSWTTWNCLQTTIPHSEEQFFVYLRTYLKEVFLRTGCNTRLLPRTSNLDGLPGDLGTVITVSPHKVVTWGFHGLTDIEWPARTQCFWEAPALKSKACLWCWASGAVRVFWKWELLPSLPAPRLPQIIALCIITVQNSHRRSLPSTFLISSWTQELCEVQSAACLPDRQTVPLGRFDISYHRWQATPTSPALQIDSLSLEPFGSHV